MLAKGLIQKFNETVRDVSWNKALAEEIQDYLNRQNYSLKAIDKLLMAVTKLVESGLREAVRDFTGEEIPRNKRHGIDLLNYAKSKGLIPEPRRGTDRVYYAMYWYMSTQRNTTHHVFTNFGLPALMLLVSTGNYILDQIERLAKSNEFYKAKISAEYDATNYIMRISVEDIIKGDENANVASMDAHLKAPDKAIRTIPLQKNEFRWQTQINTYGYALGTYRVDVAGYTDNKVRFTVSGSTIVVL